MSTLICKCLIIFSCINVYGQNEELPDGLQSHMNDLQLPYGFTISVFAYNRSVMQEPRKMDYFSYNDTLSIVYVGSGRYKTLYPVYALIDIDNDASNDHIISFLHPDHSEYRDGTSVNTILVDHVTNYTLIISEMSVYECYNMHSYVISLIHFNKSDIDLHCRLWMQFEPAASDHIRHCSKFSPNYQHLCIPFGTPCDRCLSSSPHGTIRCYDMNKIRNYNQSLFPLQWNDTNSFVIANGIRNVLDFDWDKNTNDIWFGDMDANRVVIGNSSQNMFDEFDSELNIIKNFNRFNFNVSHFGFPYFTSSGTGSIINRDIGNVFPFHHTEFIPQRDVSFYKLAEQPLGPRAGPMGLAFYHRHLFNVNSKRHSNSIFPQEYDNVIFLALGGIHPIEASRIGYVTGCKIITVEIGKNENNESFIKNYKDFIVFRENEANSSVELDSFWSRPSFIEFMDDGSMLIADDMHSWIIYRIQYNERESDTSNPWVLFNSVASSIFIYTAILILIGTIFIFICWFTKRLKKLKSQEGIPLL
eukprot:368455_1